MMKALILFDIIFSMMALVFQGLVSPLIFWDMMVLVVSLPLGLCLTFGALMLVRCWVVVRDESLCCSQMNEKEALVLTSSSGQGQVSCSRSAPPSGEACGG